jgi:hypothetical protein
MLDTLIQSVLDFIAFFQWLFANLKIIFTCLLSPISYVFNVIGHFWSSAFLTPPTPDLVYTFSPEVLAVFNSIPHWAIFTAILGAVIIVFGGIAILQLFLHT